jgi:hypothetical protein
MATTDINPTGSPLINSYMFGWNRTLQSYYFEINLNPGFGYWFYAYEPCDILVQYDNISIDSYITNLEAGWNAISLPYNQLVNKTEIFIDDVPWNIAVSNGLISDFVFGWDRNTQSYNFADTLMPGFAYWMYAYQSCTLKKVN